LRFFEACRLQVLTLVVFSFVFVILPFFVLSFAFCLFCLSPFVFYLLPFGLLPLHSLFSPAEAKVLAKAHDALQKYLLGFEGFRMTLGYLGEFYLKYPEYKGLIKKDTIISVGELKRLWWCSGDGKAYIYTIGHEVVAPPLQTLVKDVKSFKNNAGSMAVSRSVKISESAALFAFAEYFSHNQAKKVYGKSVNLNHAEKFFYVKHPEFRGKGFISKDSIIRSGGQYGLCWEDGMCSLSFPSKLPTPSQLLTSSQSAVVGQEKTSAAAPAPALRPLFIFIDDAAKAAAVSLLLSTAPVIGVDLEGDLSPNGRLSLIQISMEVSENNVDVYIFDIYSCPEMMTEGGLSAILSKRGVRKVMHDCRRDSQALFYQYNTQLCDVLDTQAAHNVLCGSVHRVGLNTVLQKYAKSSNDKKCVVKHREGLWETRPIDPDLLSYAAQDVVFFPIVYASMVAALGDKMFLALQNSDANVECMIRKGVRFAGSVPEDFSPMGLLTMDGVGTSKYVKFDSKGANELSDKPFDLDDISDTTSFDSSSCDIADLMELVSVLPEDIKAAFCKVPLHKLTTEIVLDIGRRPLIRFVDKVDDKGPTITGSGTLSCPDVTMQNLRSICAHERLGSFTSDNRAGFSSTLHRISRKLNRSGDTIGLTMRVGRMVQGSTQMIADIVASKCSVLLLGTPGVGKTTLLREYARVLADSGRRVEIVDTSNEIAGDGDVPHHSVGNARRMMVNNRDEQHRVMIEAVQNHMPETVIVDEIATGLEAQAAGDIAQRGVQIIATAHGTTLKDLLQSQELCVLLGGVHTVVLGDEEVRNRGLRSKSVRERKGPPVFDTIVELRSYHRWVVYHDVINAVDDLLNEKKLFLK
jgi:stage III sporulation protein SpoIIIAA